MTKLYRYIPKNCEQCGKYYLAGFYKTKFCGMKCQAKARIGLPNKSAVKEFCKSGHDLSIHRKVQNNGKKYCSQCNNDRNRGYKLKKNYGMTEADFEVMLASQNRCCAICGTDDHNSRNWHIDHDHATGKVRGILCGGCNHGLGNFIDNVKLLIKAAMYLVRHNVQNCIA